ncbi:MAG: cobalt-precorrin-5B (C(1))-methyltransferase CbiD [Lachnotalea sp.]
MKAQSSDRMENGYTFKNNKKLRYGYTTGSCAAAASKAAAIMLFRKCDISKISILTPKGISLELEVLDIASGSNFVSCAIKKDSGDDPDVTNGILVYAKISKTDGKDIEIDGGIGVGRVTKPGLEQPVNSAAINRVPRQMIYDEVINICNEFDYQKGMRVEISIPEGIEIAKKTFNPRLGIKDGISVLGTSGIVEPMSEAALIDSIKVEMKMLKASGKENLLVTLGNYGENFSINELNIDINDSLKCSNFIGETIDYAVELEFKSVLFIGHIGKLVKTAGGIMNTHSRNADARMDILVAAAILGGISLEGARQVLNCITTDEAIATLMEERILDLTMQILVDKMQFYMSKRAYDKINIEIVTFSNEFGLLGKTKQADELGMCFKRKE